MIVIDSSAMRPMTEEEISAAAVADPDARPMTPEQLRSARRVPRTKTLRRVLALTQEEFATRYRIPVGMVRDWEQGRSEPDQPARAYLTVIARDPEGVRQILKRHSEAMIAGMEAISARCAARPVVDPRSAEEIIGYDDFGLPR